jgi:hypothetical protein
VTPLLLATLLIVSVGAPAFSAEDYTAKVIGIADGDTITVLRGRD